jgi:hypothetical protein
MLGVANERENRSLNFAVKTSTTLGETYLKTDIPISPLVKLARES